MTDIKFKAASQFLMIIFIFLFFQMWTKSWRWSSHPDMIQQYARCIARNLDKHNIHNVELYFDVWISLNKRFQQR